MAAVQRAELQLLGLSQKLLIRSRHLERSIFCESCRSRCRRRRRCCCWRSPWVFQPLKQTADKRTGQDADGEQEVGAVGHVWINAHKNMQFVVRFICRSALRWNIILLFLKVLSGVLVVNWIFCSEREDNVPELIWTWPLSCSAASCWHFSDSALQFLQNVWFRMLLLLVSLKSFVHREWCFIYLFFKCIYHLFLLIILKYTYL